MSDTQNQPNNNNKATDIQGAQELLTDDPNTQDNQQVNQAEVVDEFDDFVAKANRLLEKRYDIIVPTTQDDMVMINKTIETNDAVRKQLNMEREKKRRYNDQGYAYPLKPEIKKLLEDLERSSNAYEERAAAYLEEEKRKNEEKAREQAEAVKADVNATPNLETIPRPSVIPLVDPNGEQPKQVQPQGGDEMAATSSGQPANPNNPSGQTVEEQQTKVPGSDVVAVDPNANGAQDGSGGHQTPATGKQELRGKGIKSNVENIQNLGGNTGSEQNGSV